MFSTLSIASDIEEPLFKEPLFKEPLFKEPLFIDAAVEPETPYIQQQVKYTLRLWRQSHLQRGYFLTPDIPDVLILPAPASSPRTVMRDGQEYELLEQTYFIFPQHSGEIRLPPPVFSSQDLFIKGKPLLLTVKPAINEKNMPSWVIATNMTLDQQWHFPDQALQIGQPIERTLVIRGEDITGAQLPRPGIQPIENISIQQQPAETRYDLTDERVHGTRIERFRYIPTQAGDYQLNDITLNWWNSPDNKQLKAVVRGRKIHINPASTIQTERASDTDSDSNSDTEYDDALSAEPENHTTGISTGISSRVTSWLSSNGVWLLLFLLLSFITYLLCKYSLYQLLEKHFELYLFRRDVLSACKKEDHGEIKNSLLKWAQVKFNTDSLSTLLSLSQFTTDQNAIEVLSALDQALYSENHQPYSAEQLKLALQRFMSCALAKSNKKNPVLPDMWVNSRS